MKVSSIAIVGGGLAGLATAAALSHFGIEADVFEGAPRLGEIGAGINVSPQAIRALRAIGLGDKIAAIANVAPGVLTRDMHTGAELDYRDQTGAERVSARRFALSTAPICSMRLRSGVDRARIHLDHRAGRNQGAAIGRRTSASPTAAVATPASLDRRGRRSLGGPAHALWRRQSGLHRPDGLARAVAGQRGVRRRARAVRPYPVAGLRPPFLRLLSARPRCREHRHPGRHRQWVEEGWSIPGDPDDMRDSFPNPEPRLQALSVP